MKILFHRNRPMHALIKKAYSWCFKNTAQPITNFTVHPDQHCFSDCYGSSMPKLFLPLNGSAETATL